MAKKTKTKLTVELIPSTCHYSNVRTTIKPKDWNILRFASYEKAKHRCEICKEIGTEQGYPHNLECHEIWDYDDVTKVQKLIGLISLCPLCHQVKHIGRANAMGRQADVFEQLEKVNDWTHKDVVDHVAKAFEQYKERSKYEWLLDLSLLTEEPYNMDINLEGKRKVKKPRMKRRRRRRAK